MKTSLSEAKVVGGNQDVNLKIPGFEGFEMIVKANSVTFPDGAKVGPLVVFPVHLDKLPMVPPSGTATFMAPAWTIQPSGTRFDPPIEVRIPNSINLKAGETREIYQWDHDLATFVPMGRATVNEDASLLVSDAGSGITKAGWGGPPSVPPPEPDCAKTSGPTDDDCGEKCQRSYSTRGACGPQTFCAVPDPQLTSERYSCCDGKKYDKDKECCKKIPVLVASSRYGIATKGKPFAEQSSPLKFIKGPKVITGFDTTDISPPMQYKGPPIADAENRNVDLIPRAGVTYAVDGCSVPPLLTATMFPPGLFINKARQETLINQHPDAEAFYVACEGHDYCYQTCGSLQSDCDSTLKNRLLSFCESIPPEWIGSGAYDPLPGFRVSRKTECIINTYKVYSGLVAGGAFAHATRQNEMCLVCDE